MFKRNYIIDIRKSNHPYGFRINPMPAGIFYVKLNISVKINLNCLHYKGDMLSDIIQRQITPPLPYRAEIISLFQESGRSMR
jgi:hypothetical protein